MKIYSFEKNDFSYSIQQKIRLIQLKETRSLLHVTDITDRNEVVVQIYVINGNKICVLHIFRIFSYNPFPLG